MVTAVCGSEENVELFTPMALTPCSAAKQKVKTRCIGLYTCLFFHATQFVRDKTSDVNLINPDKEGKGKTDWD